MSQHSSEIVEHDPRGLTVWVLSLWLAGSWNGLPWGFWGYLTSEDFGEVTRG